MPTKIFVNLAVQDLEKSKAFYTAMGFSINPQFSDDTAACVVMSESIYAMIMTHEAMKRFTKREIIDATRQIEVMNALAFDSREQVDAIAQKALTAGGKPHREPEDLGWMYNRPIEDLDGHVWEIFTMDMSKMPQNPQ